MFLSPKKQCRKLKKIHLPWQKNTALCPCVQRGRDNFSTFFFHCIYLWLKAVSGSTGSYRPGEQGYLWKQQKAEYCIGKTETFGGTEMFKGLDREKSGDDLKEG